MPFVPPGVGDGAKLWGLRGELFCGYWRKSFLYHLIPRDIFYEQDFVNVSYVLSSSVTARIACVCVCTLDSYVLFHKMAINTH